MERGTTPRSVERLQDVQPLLWLFAVLFFGIGDVVTTGIGLGIEGIHEAGPVTGAAIERYGQLSMVVIKAGVIGGGYVLWLFAPRPHRVGVPLGLAVLGVVVVSWNLSVTVFALL